MTATESKLLKVGDQVTFRLDPSIPSSAPGLSHIVSRQKMGLVERIASRYLSIRWEDGRVGVFFHEELFYCSKGWPE